MKKMINLMLAITMVMGMLGVFAFDYANIENPLAVQADGVATDEVVTVEELQARIKELEDDVAYYKEWYVEPYDEDEDELRIRLDYHLKDARVRLADGTYALRAVEVGENIVLDDVSEVSVLHNYREEFMILPIENFDGQLKIAVTFDEGKTVELIDWGCLNTVNSLARGEKVDTGLKLKKLRKYNGIGRDHITLYKYVACVVEDAASEDGFDSAIRVKAKVECIHCEHSSEWECNNAKCECTGCDCYVKPHCTCHDTEAECKSTGCTCECCYTAPKHCTCHDTETECKRTGCTCECCYTAPKHCDECGHGNAFVCYILKCVCDGCDCYEATKHCDKCYHNSKDECVDAKCECTYCDCYEKSEMEPDNKDENVDDTWNPDDKDENVDDTWNPDDKDENVDDTWNPDDKDENVDDTWNPDDKDENVDDTGNPDDKDENVDDTWNPDDKDENVDDTWEPDEKVTEDDEVWESEENCNNVDDTWEPDEKVTEDDDVWKSEENCDNVDDTWNPDKVTDDANNDSWESEDSNEYDNDDWNSSNDSEWNVTEESNDDWLCD